MQFDIATLHTATFFLLLMLAAFHAMLWFKHRDQPALLIWTAGNLLSATGVMLFLHSEQVGPVLGAVLPSTAVVLFMAFAWFGVRHVLGRSLPVGPVLCLISVHMLVSTYFALIEPLMWARFATTGIAKLSLCAVIVLDLLRLRRQFHHTSLAAMAGLFLLDGFITVAALVNVVLSRPDAFYLQLDNSLAAVAVLEALVTTTLVNIIIAFLLQERLYASLDRAVLTDSLTGLANRHQLGSQYMSAIAQYQRDGHSPAVCLVDLDSFKDVNDMLGHPQGDRLLVKVASVLSAALGTAGTLARLGGDEFAIVLNGVPDPQGHVARCRTLAEALAQGFEIDAIQVQVSASIGIALVEQADQDLTESLRRAEIAMYAVKQAGRGDVMTFDPRLDSAVHETNWLRAELRRALDADELTLVYQPKYDVSISPPRIAGVEALVRWNHPARGPISPAVFIPLAEQAGMIKDLGNWVLRRACEDGAQWADITIAVNISPVQFDDDALIGRITAILADTGLAAHRLELEITEGVLLKNVAGTRDMLARLKSLGTRLALDDFGTGYSSLSYLKNYRFDTIKIDRSFVQDCLRRNEAQAITQAVIQLAQALQVDVVAEGVETAAELECLQALGCRYIQGFLLGRPMSLGALATLLPRAQPRVARLRA